MDVIDCQSLIQMYKKGFFPMGKNAINNEVDFFKPYKRFIIPIKNFHLPRRLFKEFKKKNIYIRLITILKK